MFLQQNRSYVFSVFALTKRKGNFKEGNKLSCELLIKVTKIITPRQREKSRMVAHCSLNVLNVKVNITGKNFLS